MKKKLFLIWLLLPVILIYFHFGPGQKYQKTQQALALSEIAWQYQQSARQTNNPDDWQKVVENYNAALALLESHRPDLIQRVRLARNNAMVYQGHLYEAINDLNQQLDDTDSLSSDFQNDLRDTLARAQFAAAWVMRLEGAPNQLWLNQADQARQHFRWLAESDNTNNQKTLDWQKNLEAAIRLQRMDASVIAGLPLPEEAQNGQGQSLSDKMQDGQQASQPSTGQQQGKGDARDGAGISQRQSTEGS